MMFSTYCRIENEAGGVWASDRAFIRAARACVHPDWRCDPDLRAARHALYRNVFAEREAQRDLCTKWFM